MNSMQAQLKAIRPLVRKTPRTPKAPAAPTLVSKQASPRCTANMNVVSYTWKLPL